MIDRHTRILLVTRNLPPLVGGMERLNWHMAEELAKVADVRVVGPEGSSALAPVGIKVCEAPLKPLWKFLWRARRLARREARQWRPGIVLAGSGLAAPIARSAARLCGARTVVYVHGLDVAVRHFAYRALWLPAIRSAGRVIANSNATAELCRGAGVNATRIGVVHPGVDLPDASSLSREKNSGEGPAARDMANARSNPRSGKLNSSALVGAGSREMREGVAFRQHNQLENRPLLLSVGRLSARKGLREFVTHCLPRIVAARPDAMLLVVGGAPTQALRAEVQTPQSIQLAAEDAGVGQHIRLLGTVSDYAKLGRIYRAADVHVFPVREIPGDPEGFGMVAVEAAAHGLPTVAFMTGGVMDAVAEGRSGYLIPPGDYILFADAVLKALAARETLARTCVAFAQHFAWTAFGEQLTAQLSEFQSPVSRAERSSA